jgi:hypothetical protein
MRTKSVEQSIQDTEEPEFRLRKALGPLDLTLFGIGGIIGTGLFVLIGEAAAGYAGPAVTLSYVVGGIVCALAALCYAEFASTVPVAGSAGSRQRIHLLLRNSRRVCRLADWVGPHPGVHSRRCHGGKGMVGVLGERLRDRRNKAADEPLRLPRVRRLPRLDSADRGSPRDDDSGHRDKVELAVQRGDHNDQDPRNAVHHRLRDILHKGV